MSQEIKLCKDCHKLFNESHCCCEPHWEQSIQCSGHRMKINYCAGRCLDCGWGGCICFVNHCCCPDVYIDYCEKEHEYYISKKSIHDEEKHSLN